MFEFKNKLVTPYKSFRNNFALDTSKSIFSADVYGIAIPDALNSFLILGFMNSSLAEFGVKYNAKKIDYRYEYYEEALSALPIPKGIVSNLECKTLSISRLSQLAKDVLKMSDAELCSAIAGLAKLASDSGESPEIRRLVDVSVGRLFGLNASQIDWATHFVDQEIEDNAVKLGEETGEEASSAA